MIPQNKKNLLQSFKNLHQSRKASQIKSQLKQNNLSSQVMSQQSEFQEKTILSNRSNLSQASSQNFSYINTNPVSPAQSQFKNTFLQFTNRLREFQSDLNVQREDLKLKQQNTKQDQALTTNIETDDILNTQINKEQNLDQSFNKIPHKFNLKQFK
ncbi:hypothetical protein ABPG73_000228 [Tetrahymena malaccensis]